MDTLLNIFSSIQTKLFPWLEEELSPLTEKEQVLVQVISLMNICEHIREYQWHGFGRPRRDRENIVKAFVAKAAYNFDTTKVLIEYLKGSKNLRRLCGWESKGHIPSEATFSRAFGEFSSGTLPEKIHEAMVRRNYSTKLAGHVSRDSTAISAREKPAPKQIKSKPKRKRGRPGKGEQVSARPAKRLDVQPTRTLKDNLLDLPVLCDVGTKINSKGYKKSWIGYKLHIDVVDGDIPVSALLTSASVHDSQVAVPLAQMSAGRIDSLYDLMDSAYDAPQIRSFCKQLGHVPIIDQNPRRGSKIPMDPAAERRYFQRSSVERVNGVLKDNYGGSNIRVKGHQKVMAHLMFGLIVITASQIFKLLC